MLQSSAPASKINLKDCYKYIITLATLNTCDLNTLLTQYQITKFPERWSWFLKF